MNEGAKGELGGTCCDPRERDSWYKQCSLTVWFDRWYVSVTRFKTCSGFAVDAAASARLAGAHAVVNQIEASQACAGQEGIC